MNTVDLTTFREMLKTELPRLLHEYPETRYEIWDLMLEVFPAREETNRLLEEIQALREASDRHFAERQQQFVQVDQRFEQVDQRFEGLETRMESGFQAVRQDLGADIQAVRQDLGADIQAVRQEMDSGFQEVRQETQAGIQTVRLDLDRLGSRWGIRSESVFRQTVATLLEKSYGAQVETRTIDGEEFDVIVSDGAHILVEITASAGPKTQERLERKRRLYIATTGVTPARVILATAAIHSRRAQALRDAGFEVIEPEEEALE